MNKTTIKRGAFALVFMAIGIVFLFYSNEDEQTYQTNQGNIFGTYYNIRYQSGKDLHEAIQTRLQQFDASLSMFNPNSILSRVNRNEQVTTDADFEAMFAVATKVNLLSNGAFDITVAPLVNAWGFGFANREQITPNKIDSLLQQVGFNRVYLTNHQVYKQHENIMLDAGAIAKGQACDVVADFLKEHGCTNFLVDIGGEVVAQGVNDKGETWRVGIVKPIDDPTGRSNQLQEVITASSICMATSGNYRQFYYENGMRRSHTIDPRTGFPVQHNLLSATIIAPTCMEADALATACMVLGAEKGYQMISELDSIECYLIVATDSAYQIVQTPAFADYLQ